VLEKILKELQYQTQLMENIFEKKDAHQVGVATIKKQIEAVQKVILNTPGINPEMVKMINSILNITPGGSDK